MFWGYKVFFPRVHNPVIMRVILADSADEVAAFTADHIVNRINAFQPTGDRPFVLGLPTGATPLQTYHLLIQAHKAGKVSFSNVVTFNMDEYVGLPRTHPQSYWTFMHTNFFNHVDLPARNINMLDGTANDPEAECRQYEEKIKQYGKIHLFLGGVGQDGHIAFNEPFSSLTSRTRLKTLVEDTRVANARFFEGEIDKVPKQALTVGVGTLMDAEELLILAMGHRKSLAVQAAVEQPISHLWTISCLQLHPRGILVCDEPAYGDLKYKTVQYFKEVERDSLSALKK